MTQSFHSGVTMRAPVSLLILQFPLYIFRISSDCISTFSLLFLENSLKGIIHFSVQLSKDDFTVFGGVYGNKEDSAFQNLEVGCL